MPAATHRFINSAQLSRELGVSPYMLAKMIVRGQVPGRDGYLAGREVFNADKLASIRAGLAKLEEAQCQP